MANLPQFNTKRFSIGPAIIYFGAAGVTPTADMGAVTDATLKITAENNKFLMGIPAAAQWYRFKSIEVSLAVKGLEWNLDLLRKVMGGYYIDDTVGSYDIQTLFGTFEYVEPFSIRLVHTTPAGGTLTLDIFEALPGGGLDVAFGSKVHELPYTFYAISASTDFSGNALPPNTTFKLVLETPNG